MRYITLILLNLPIVLLALVNLVTKYKTNKITRKRLIRQVTFWVILFVVIVASFPVYNVLSGSKPLESAGLSFFDIVQTTAIIILVYIANNQRQKAEASDKRLRDLHQELSIRLSK